MLYSTNELLIALGLSRKGFMVGSNSGAPGLCTNPPTSWTVNLARRSSCSPWRARSSIAQTSPITKCHVGHVSEHFNFLKIQVFPLKPVLSLPSCLFISRHAISAYIHFYPLLISWPLLASFFSSLLRDCLKWCFPVGSLRLPRESRMGMSKQDLARRLKSIRALVPQPTVVEALT
ncbi:uncharacterized protein LOC114174159 [Vigna unguiculata]|uniref:uncharacterized protein LOC114174159 n=1 Tax=Vigna unguiculata TaxID=3917 RepID=UPI001016FAFE|nr:uncharacterized protein LOC114174159 [Vigna unguiculata]